MRKRVSAEPGEIVRVRVPFCIRKRGGRKLVVVPAGSASAPERPRVDNAMVKALARAFRWRKLLETGVHATFEELRRQLDAVIRRGRAHRDGDDVQRERALHRRRRAIEEELLPEIDRVAHAPDRHQRPRREHAAKAAVGVAQAVVDDEGDGAAIQARRGMEYASDRNAWAPDYRASERRGGDRL